MGTSITIKAEDVKQGDAIRDMFQGRLRHVVSNVDERGRRLIYTHEGYFSLRADEPVEVIRGLSRSEVEARNVYL